MKKLIKLFTLILFFAINLSCAQTTMKSVNDAKKIELNKKKFIGKPLSYLLSKMNVEIKSILPTPNKNKAEINRLYLRYIEEKDFKKTNSKEVIERPTQVVITFNQNWNLSGERCMTSNPKCTEWTKEDEKNLGSLIIYDIYVLGKN